MLTKLQRSKINYHLRSGNTLPKKEEEPPRTTRDSGGCFSATRLRTDSRRRSLDAIKSSGAYEHRPSTVIGPYREPTDLAKKRLQQVMSGIKGTPRTARRMKGNVAQQQDDLLDTNEGRIQQCKGLLSHGDHS